MAKVGILQECDHQRMTNDSGAALEQGEFTVIGTIPCVADEAIAADAIGSFHIQEFITIRTSDLVAGELTFGTPNQLVYWDPTTGDFSDTEQDGYYIVGQLKQIVEAGVVIEFIKFDTAELVTT